MTVKNTLYWLLQEKMERLKPSTRLMGKFMLCFLMLARMVFNLKMMLFLACIYSGERGHLGHVLCLHVHQKEMQA
uniref:Uncharacterized protein n=1 Tax=Salix viminalis TaxID=40686 RepID=A0A6N2ME28_SALVM